MLLVASSFEHRFPCDFPVSTIKGESKRPWHVEIVAGGVIAMHSDKKGTCIPGGWERPAILFSTVLIPSQVCPHCRQTMVSVHEVTEGAILTSRQESTLRPSSSDSLVEEMPASVIGQSEITVIVVGTRAERLRRLLRHRNASKTGRNRCTI